MWLKVNEGGLARGTRSRTRVMGLSCGVRLGAVIAKCCPYYTLVGYNSVSVATSPAELRSSHVGSATSSV